MLLQQLCVIRGKLPFLSCMVSRVRLVKKELTKKRIQNACAVLQPHQKRAYKKACAVLQAPNKVDKERVTTSQLYNSTKKGA